VLYTGSGYMDYLRVSHSGKEVAFLEHPIYGDDRGWVSVVDDAGHHRQLTQEFSTVQGLAWSAKGNEIWFTASDMGADRQIYAVTLAGKVRSVLTNPLGTRILDIAPDGRVLLLNERQQSDIAGIDPATGKERRGLEWFDGSAIADITPDGKAITFLEWGGPAGPLYIDGYRKMDGSAPVALGPGGGGKFSPDGAIVATELPSRPPQVALNPVGAGESRRLSLGDITNLRVGLAWFPDGKHLLLTGAPEGQPTRTFVMDTEGGKPQALGPAGFLGVAVAGDGNRVAGRNAAEEYVVFDRQTEKVQTISGIQPQDQIQRWTDDGQALIVYSTTAWAAHVYRVEVATGKRTLLQTIELSEKAGSRMQIRLAYAERSKTYAYSTTRDLGILYVVEGLQ
jgi:Tol biopolymer transport system component